MCAIGLASAAISCNKTGPCYGIKAGDRVAITVVDVDEQGIYATSTPCKFGFDITQGLVLLATDVDNPASQMDGASCNSAVVRVDPFGNWNWTPQGVSADSEPTILTGKFTATNGACSGDVTLLVTIPSYGENPFVTSEAGPTQTVVMQRGYEGRGGGAACPSSCMDHYSVSLARL